MDGKAKEANQFLGLGRGDTIPPARPLVPLEDGLVWAVEDEYWLYRRSQESHESVEEGSDGGVGSPPCGLVLELPDGKIDGEAERAAVVSETLGRELC